MADQADPAKDDKKEAEKPIDKTATPVDVPLKVPSPFAPTDANTPPPYLLLPEPEPDPSLAHSPARDPSSFRPDVDQKTPFDWHPLTLLCRALDGCNITFIVVAAILFLTASGTVFYKHQFHTMRAHDRLNFCDYAKYYTCGKMVGTKDALHVYDAATQARYLATYGLNGKKTTEEFIHYPPIDFPLMALFTTESIDKSYQLFWTAGSLLFLFGTLALSRAARPGKYLLTMLFFSLAAYGSVPMWRAFSLGQSSLFLTALTALYLRGLIKNRSLTGGLCLALSAIKPQYTVFLAVPALAQRRYKMLVWALLFEVALLAIAYKMIGLPNILNYPAIVMHAEQTASLAGGFVAEMVNVRGLLAATMGDATAVKLAGAMAVVAWLVLAAFWLRFCPRFGGSDDQTFKLLLAATICTCLTFSPHTHLYDCLFVLLVYIVTGQSSLTAALRTRAAGLNWPGKVLAIMLLLYPVAGWAFVMMPGGVGAARTMPFALYNLALCFVTLAALTVPQPVPRAKGDLGLIEMPAREKEDKQADQNNEKTT